jgi:HK97 family phage major capsid protein
LEGASIVEAPSGAHDGFKTARVTSVEVPDDECNCITQTLGHVMKMKDSLGRPLLQANPSQTTSDMLLGRAVVVTPNAPVGTVTLIDSSQVHVAMDIDGNALILNERYAEFDSIGLRVVSRFDVQVINRTGVVVVDNLT